MNPDVINYAFGIIGTILGVAGLIYAYYLHRKNIRIKEPVYSVPSANIISDYSSVFRGLTVSYRGEKVENFTVSKIIFFNNGTVVLDRDDIASLNPLRIVAKNCNILDTTILAVNNPSSAFATSFDKANGIIAIDFEYLNQNDGVVLAVIHTGLSSKDIELAGDMKEVTGIRRISPDTLKKTPAHRQQVGMATRLMGFVLLLVLSIVFVIWAAYKLFDEGEYVFDAFFPMVILFGAMIGAPALYILRLLYRMEYQGITIPKGLEIFTDDTPAFP